MNHWLTVHHPPEAGANPEPGVSGVWVPSKRSEDFPQLAVGDQVLIYETKAGPSRTLVRAGEEPRRSRYQRAGMGAVMAVGWVESIPPREVARAIHDDGQEIGWVKLAVLTTTPLKNPVPLARLNTILGR